MSKRSKFTNIEVEPQDGFKKELDGIIDDEFYKACKKWSIPLNIINDGEIKKLISDKTFEQVHSKVISAYKNPADEDFKKILITLEGDPEDTPESEIYIEYKSGTWRIKTTFGKNDNLDRVYRYDELNNEIFTNQIREWIRTSVFYGVGSFSN